MNWRVTYAGVSGLPWGAVGRSGFGRIHGAEGLRQMIRTPATARERFPIPLKLASFERYKRTSPTFRGISKVLHASLTRR
jgi:hypothetical protein